MIYELKNKKISEHTLEENIAHATGPVLTRTSSSPITRTTELIKKSKTLVQPN
jgi:hypothetical protein